MKDMVEMYKKDFVSEEGETYAVIKGRLLSDVVVELAKDLNIRLNWPVSKIEDRNGKITLFGPKGEALTCGRVIVTGTLLNEFLADYH